MSTITGSVVGPDGHRRKPTCPITVRPRLGATATPSTTASMLSVLGAAKVRYMRSYGKDSDDPDALPELDAHGTDKLALAPPGCVVHVGWKDDVEQLGPWLAAAPGTLRYLVTWWHEPMDGDVDGPTYRATAGRITQILAGHPKRNLVLGHGPCLTRYWIENGGNVADFWYPGATILFADTYNPGPSSYRTAEGMFGPIAAAARALGVPWGVPEYGMALISGDTGSGRAAAMRAHYQWLQQQPDCVCVGWWDIGGDRLTNRPGSADLAALQEVLS